MGVTQYVGARYVPLFADPEQWTDERTYEPLTVVLHQGNSFTSKQFVPVGIDIDNGEFWAETGNYNAQVEAYRQEVLGFDGRIVNASNLVRNVDELKAKNFSDGAFVKTQFYYENDNGGSFYTVNSVCAQNCISLDNGKYAHPIIDRNKIYVDQFGAKGDGITDDYSAIQKALDYANQGAEIVFSSAKTYYVSKRLTSSIKYLRLQGEGKNEFLPSIVSPMLETVMEIKNDGYVISGINFTNQSELDTRYGTAILVSRGGNSDALSNLDIEVNNCGFSHFEYAVMSIGRNVNIENCLISQCKNGIFFKDYRYDNTYSVMRGWIVNNCRFHAMGPSDSPTVEELYADSVSQINCWCVQTEFNANANIQNICVKDNLCDSNQAAGFYKGYSNGLFMANNSVSTGAFTYSMFAYLFRTNQTRKCPGLISNNVVASRANDYYNLVNQDDSRIAGYWHFIVSENSQRYLKIDGNYFEECTRAGIKIQGREIQVCNNNIDSAGFGIETNSAFIHLIPSTGVMQVHSNSGVQLFKPKANVQYAVFSEGNIRSNASMIANNSFMSTLTQIITLDSIRGVFTSDNAQVFVNEPMQGENTLQKVLVFNANGLEYRKVSVSGDVTTVWNIPKP